MAGLTWVEFGYDTSPKTGSCYFIASCGESTFLSHEMSDTPNAWHLAKCQASDESDELSKIEIWKSLQTPKP
jgi:hypothetical protein